MSAYDRVLFRRALGIGALAFSVVLLIVVTTDGGAGFEKRVALCAALCPVSGALGTFGASQVARARGEARALAALGVHPSRALLGAVIGGALLGFVGTSVVVSGVAELAPLFPRPVEASIWEPDSAGAMVERRRGLVLRPGGELEVREVLPARERDRSGADRRAAVSVALLCLSIAAPLSSIRPSVSFARLSFLVALLLLAIASFQLVAAGLLPAFGVCVSPLLLLANAFAARYGPLPER